MPGKSYAVDLVMQEERASTGRGASAKLGPVPDKRPPLQGGSKGQHGKARRQRPDSESDGSSSSGSDGEGQCCGTNSFEDSWRYPMYSPSASYRQVDVVSGSHQYTISGFPLARSMGCGTRLCSDFFEICGQLFRLEVYPGGFTADTRRFVSVFLTTPGTVNPNQIMYELAILDQSGKDRHIVEKRSSYSHQRFASGMCHMHGPMLAYSRGIVAALPKFIKAKFLQEHCQRYMPCGMLVLRATVQVLRGWSSPPVVHSHMGQQPYAGGAGIGIAGQPQYSPMTGGQRVLLGAQAMSPYVPVHAQHPMNPGFLPAPAPQVLPMGPVGLAYAQVPHQPYPSLPTPWQGSSVQPSMYSGAGAQYTGQSSIGQPQPQHQMYTTPPPQPYLHHTTSSHVSAQQQPSPAASPPTGSTPGGRTAALVKEPRFLVYMASPNA